MNSKSVKKIKIKPRTDRKVAKSKRRVPAPVFKAKKVVTKVTYSDVCPIPALQRDIQGGINSVAFNYIGDHIVSLVNEVTGRVPRTGESFSAGRVVLYLWRCFAAYQIKAGTFVGDISNHPEYLNFAIPGYVATLFENSSVFRDERYGSQIRLQDSNYDTNMHAYITNEGSTRCPVWNSEASLNEPVFSNGTPVGYSDLTLANSREISDLIAKAFKHVTFIKDIQPFASRLNDLIGSGNTSFKPLSIVQIKLSLAIYSKPIFPCTYINGATLNWTGSTAIKGLQWLLQDYLYVPGRTINKMVSSIGINPYRYNATATAISAVSFSALVATVIKETGAISALSDGLTCWRSYVNNYIYLFTSYFARHSWISRSALNSAYPAAYVNEAMRSLQLPPVFAMLGSQPVRHGDTLVVPYFDYAADNSALISHWQSSTTVNKNDSYKFPTGTVAYGDINTPMTYFANMPAFPIAVKYNFVPLNVLDLVTSYAATNAWNTVEPAYSRVDAGGKACDCLTSVEFSKDTFLASQVVGNSFSINWLSNRVLLSDCAVDLMACVCSKGASLYGATDVDTLAAHFEPVYTNTGEPTSLVVVSGIRNDQFDNMYAAMQNKDVGKAVMSFFKSKMAQSFHQEEILVKADNFVDMVKKVASQDLALPPAPEDWITRITGSNLGQAVIASAAAVATYGPKVYQALRQMTDISVRAAA